MITWFVNLFKKKETLLVAVVTIHYQTRFFFEKGWHPERATYRCYERSDGKRTLDIHLTSGSGDKSRVKVFATAGLLYDWSMHQAHILAMPTYADIKSGRKIVWTRQCDS